MNKSLFRTDDGKNLAGTFALVSSLFLLWGFCNGMIDVMDKHFQEELHLTLSQSAWVQFAHYLGYFLMSLPAGWLASKLGYKGGIVAGLLMVAVGGFWFLPATHIASFWAFLLGVWLIASGLTFLETVANPYTTVLGPREYAATRINIAQSCNGVGWVFGPMAGSMFFYSTDAAGKSTGAHTLWIPYVGVGVVVVILALVFLRAKLPDIKTEDNYHLDDQTGNASTQPASRGASLFLVWLNLLILGAAIGMIAAAGVSGIASEHIQLQAFLVTGGVIALIGSLILCLRAKRVSHDSIWLHPHFSSATIAQFFYVAAQAGIFGFFINYLTSQAPIAISNQKASALASGAFICFLVGRATGAWLLKTLPPHRVLAFFGVANVAMCALVACKLGWLSLVAVFLSYFFMSIMFPTIFALGIFGLGARAKKASSYIVMAIMGGAIVPKLMGHIADETDVARSFIVPLVCFVVVALYAFLWPRLSSTDGATTFSVAHRH